MLPLDGDRLCDPRNKRRNRRDGDRIALTRSVEAGKSSLGRADKAVMLAVFILVVTHDRSPSSYSREDHTLKPARSETRRIESGRSAVRIAAESPSSTLRSEVARRDLLLTNGADRTERGSGILKVV